MIIVSPALALMVIITGDWSESSFLMYFDLERETFNKLFYKLMDTSNEVSPMVIISLAYQIGKPLH